MKEVNNLKDIIRNIREVKPIPGPIQYVLSEDEAAALILSYTTAQKIKTVLKKDT